MSPMQQYGSDPHLQTKYPEKTKRRTQKRSNLSVLRRYEHSCDSWRPVSQHHQRCGESGLCLHYNDDKKVLAFSDSVQDASHRAGFFGARTYRFNLRGALQKYVEIEGAGKTMPQLSKEFSNYWRNQLGMNQYIATFTAPNMVWLEDFEYFAAHGKLPVNSNLSQLVERRIDWEIRGEYGFNARIGRTLEKTGCSIAHVSRDVFEQSVTGLLDILRNEIGDLRQLTPEDLTHLIYGLLVRLKNQGGIFHEALEPYIESYGDVYRLGQRLKGPYMYMPWFGKNSRAPRFLTTKSGNRFDLLESPDQQRTTWHQNWAEKSLQRYSVFIRTVVGDVYRFLLNKLVDAGILEQRILKGFTIWGLRADGLLVTDAVLLLRCSHCGDTLSAASHEEDIVVGMPCLRIACSGRYEQDTMIRDYYASLYKRGDNQRIFAEEHTGLLTHEARDRIEKHFINPEENACAPNLLSCTPTLEMGIDIGDLSSAVLCSVPPKQANYLQRIGRVGRRDGNGMTVTVVGGKPHDLYFFAEPTEMLTGEVSPPGMYLSAPAVLQRQLTAFCFDTWIATQGSTDPLPAWMRSVLDGLDSTSRDTFPFNFTTYVDAHHTDLFDGFVSLFSGTLTQNDLKVLKEFFQGGEGSEGSMVYRLVDGVMFLAKQRAELRKRIRTLRTKLRNLRKSPVRDKNSEEHERALLYVAATRAKKEVWVTGYGERSEFISASAV